MPIRYDGLELSGQGRTDADGYFYDTPTLTLAEKVFVYREADGRERREYRPAAEVFRADSLKSFKGKPVTAKHPARMVSAGSVRDVAIGTIGSPPHTRGSSTTSRDRWGLLRITPAYAGKFPPRPLLLGSAKGSPPHTRGS